MTEPKGFQFRIGGKTYTSLEDLPPDQRAKFELAVQQMRDSGLLDDKNRDGIPDRFEMPLRIAGWLGRLTGNPQLRPRLQRQLQAFGITATPRPSTTKSLPRTSSAPASRMQARARVTARPVRQPVIERSGSPDPRTEGGLREFLRKLAIVSAVVTAGYVLLRMLGMA